MLESVDRSRNQYWCSQWWNHPEAVDRLRALYEQWLEAQANGGMSSWWIDHFDRHATILFSKRGAFGECGTRHAEKTARRILATKHPPPGWGGEKRFVGLSPRQANHHEHVSPASPATAEWRVVMIRSHMPPREADPIRRRTHWYATIVSTPVVWGVIIGIGQAASPLVFWWLAPSTVYAFGLAVIASIYIGFAVADGRPRVLLVEISVAAAFILIAGTAIMGSAWILVAGLVAHGFKDLWQHRTQFVRNTRWWPPFCVTVDFVAATILAALIVTGADFHA